MFARYDVVVIHGLQNSPHLNGAMGVVIGHVKDSNDESVMRHKVIMTALSYDQCLMFTHA